VDIFYGFERRFPVDADDSQMKLIGEFVSEMEKKYPDIPFKCLGYELGDDSMLYSIGLINKRPDIKEKITAVVLPDGKWENFSCPFNGRSIKKLYREIWAAGALDFEIETVDGDLFKVSVHRK